MPQQRASKPVIGWHRTRFLSQYPVSTLRRRNAKAFRRRCWRSPRSLRSPAWRFAANTYKVHLGSHQAGQGLEGEADPDRPEVRLPGRETDPNKRATVIEEYAIGSEGLVDQPEGRSRSARSAISTTSRARPAKCKKALVGQRPREERGRPEHRPVARASAPCNLKLALYNIGSGMVIRLDGEPPAPPSIRVGRRSAARFRSHTAINGKFVRTQDRWASPPATSLHGSAEPEAPVDGRRQLGPRVGQPRSSSGRGSEERQEGRLLQKVGCKGGKRLVRATFKTEATARARRPADVHGDEQTAKC